MEEVTPKLTQLLHQGGLSNREFVRLKLEAIRERERIGSKFLKRAKQALDQVLEYGSSQDVKVALASRKGYEGLPTERELLELFAEYGSEPYFGYWHNTGSAQFKENVGLMDQVQFLEQAAPYLLGCHIEDTRWPGETGQAPFTGGVDFSEILTLLPEKNPLVWRIAAGTRISEVRQALATWQERFPQFALSPQSVC